MDIAINLNTFLRISECNCFDHETRRYVQAGVAELGQRRWDEVPVRNGSQVQILPPAPLFSKSTLFDLGRNCNDYHCYKGYRR